MKEAELESVFRLYDATYALLDEVPPRRFDCGRLCGALCCKNLGSVDSPTGMLLLPYEEEYLYHRAAGGFDYLKNENETLLICDGHCDRHLRPFACRIFPYYPQISEDGRVQIAHDFRALSVCPLLSERTFRRATPLFLRNMRKATRILMQNETIESELRKNSDFLTSLRELQSALCKNVWG